jgi:copper chaperone CopZ
MTISTVTVTGMTCGHCTSAVREEIAAIAGVTDVEVDLDSGRVTITSDQDLDQGAVKAAVEEAGYQITGG